MQDLVKAMSKSLTNNDAQNQQCCSDFLRIFQTDIRSNCSSLNILVNFLRQYLLNNENNCRINYLQSDTECNDEFMCRYSKTKVPYQRGFFAQSHCHTFKHCMQGNCQNYEKSTKCYLGIEKG